MIDVEFIMDKSGDFEQLPLFSFVQCYKYAQMAKNFQKPIDIYAQWVYNIITVRKTKPKLERRNKYDEYNEKSMENI